MADNIAVTPGSGATVAADDVGGGVLVQRVKSTWGPDGTANDTDVASGKAMPVQLRDAAGKIMTGSEYEAVAASQTAQVMGATGATGDYLSHVIVSPATAGCGVVTILDNSTALVSFPGGGTTALSNLIPFVIPVGIISTSGAWKITTGANVSCVAVGKFT